MTDEPQQFDMPRTREAFAQFDEKMKALIAQFQAKMNEIFKKPNPPPQK